MSNRFGFVLAVIVTAAGCATQEGYEKVLDSYMGASEATLIARWGPPDSVYSVNNETKYLTYSKARSGYVPGVSPTYQTSCSFGICTTYAIGGSEGYAYTAACKTTFEIVDGTIRSSRYEGNACRA